MEEMIMGIIREQIGSSAAQFEATISRPWYSPNSNPLLYDDNTHPEGL